MRQVRPFPLLTVRRISRLTGQPVSIIRRLLDEHPEIRPSATADEHEVFDRDAFLRILSIGDQDSARRGGAK